MSDDKMHRGLFCGTAVILALTLAQSPAKLVSSLDQQAGLLLLPLAVPLLLLALGPSLPPVVRADFLLLAAGWGAIFRWAILLPTACLELKTTVAAMALGLFWTWLIPLAQLPPAFSTMDEPWLQRLFEPETKRAPQFSLSIIAATWLRLTGFSFNPVISGLALTAGTGRPLWATGLAACLAELYRTYFNFGSAESMAADLRIYAFILLVLPLGAWLVRVGLRNLTRPRQLVLDFQRSQGPVQIMVSVVLLISVFVLTGPEAGIIVGVSVLALLYSVLARSSIGLLLLPIWRPLELLPSAVWPSASLGLLAGVIGAVLLGEGWTRRRSSICLSRSLWGSAPVFLILVGLVFLQVPLLAEELTSFPSAGGDWLAGLFAPDFAPLLWIFFGLGVTFGILSGREIYIYLAWGLLLPVGWGKSLLIGSGLAWLFANQAETTNSVGKGLIAGDLLASLLLLLS